MFSLKLLGGASIESEDSPLSGSVVQRHRLALLALLARAPSHHLTRDKLIGYLWPESPTDVARHRLRESVHVLRKELGEAAIISVGDDLHLDPEVVGIDVAEFEEALERGELEAAVGLYAGPFLDGFYLSGSGEFERWADSERSSLARECNEALESLAREAENRGAVREAVEWWRRLATEAPYDARVAGALMQALATAGDRAGALRQAETHAAVLQKEFGAAPNPELEELAERLRAGVSGEMGTVVLERSATPHERAPDSPGAPEPGVGPRAASGTTRRRWEGIAAFATMAAVLLIVGTLVRAGLLPGTRSPESSAELDARRVLVLEFQNETGDATLDPLGRMAADWIAQELAGTGLVKVVPSLAALEESTSDSGASPTDGDDHAVGDRQLARQAGSGVLISGAYYRQGDSIAFQARLVDASTGELLQAVERVRAPLAEPAAAVELLRMRTIGALATVLDPRLASWTKVASQPPSFQAYRLFSTGMDLHLRSQGSGSWEQHQTRLGAAVERFYEAASLDSTFTMPLIWATMAHWNMGRLAEADSVIGVIAGRRAGLPPLDLALLEWLEASSAVRHGGSAADLAQDYEAMKRVVGLAPHSDWLYLFGQTAMRMRHPNEALRAFTQAYTEGGWVADWLPYWHELAWAWHRVGNYESELETVRRGKERAASSTAPSFSLVQSEIRALAALGRLEELNAVFDQFAAAWDLWPTRPGEVMIGAVDELRAHGHAESAAVMTSRMLAFFEDLPQAQRDTLPRLYRRYLATALYTAGRWEQARGALLENLKPDSRPQPDVYGRLGNLAARLGDREEALRYSAALDDFPSRRGRPHFWQASIAAHLGELDRAVSLLREAFHQGLIYNAGGGGTPDLHHYPNHDLAPLRGYPPFDELMRPKG